MNIWLLHERKTEQLRKRLDQQRLRDQIGSSEAQRSWRQRSAFRGGLLLLRLARRLIQYGRPPLDTPAHTLPVWRVIPETRKGTS